MKAVIEKCNTHITSREILRDKPIVNTEETKGRKGKNPYGHADSQLCPQCPCERKASGIDLLPAPHSAVSIEYAG
jgi:hypothetical protein